jgi:hypothetical protein
MRAKFARIGLGVVLLGCALLGPASADEENVTARLDAVLAAIGRVEERLGAMDRRLERLESRLADVEAFLQRADERLPRPASGGAAAPPQPSAGAATPAGAPAVEVGQVLLRNRRLVSAPDTGDEYLVFDVEAVVRNLQRAGRIRATFHLTDRFGTSKRSIEWTTGVLRPGERIVERDVRFRVTRSAPDDLWLRTADPREIRGRFDVVEVLYGIELQEAGAPPR